MGCMQSLLKTDADLEQLYTLGKCVGEGVEGQVYLATAVDGGEQVAIKLVTRCVRVVCLCLGGVQCAQDTGEDAWLPVGVGALASIVPASAHVRCSRLAHATCEPADCSCKPRCTSCVRPRLWLTALPGVLRRCCCRGAELGLGPEKVRREIQLLARLSHVNIVELKQVRVGCVCVSAVCSSCVQQASAAVEAAC
jgi:serine/threonine protein kinase